MKKYILLLSIGLLMLVSCQKEIVYPEGSGPGGSFNPPNSASILAGTSWTVNASASTIDYGGGLIVDYDLFALSTPCQKDDFITFNKDGSFTGDGGANKCNPNDPQILDTGKWSLSTDKKKLIINSAIQNSLGISALDCEVLELTDKKLVLMYITYLNGPKSTTTTSYTRVK